MKTRCVECGRSFDMFDDDDAAEFYFGHDCQEFQMKCPSCGNFDITTLSVGDLTKDVCSDRDNCGWGWWDADWYEQEYVL